MYERNLFSQQGWECPKCGSILSPSTMWCPFCSGKKEVTYTTTTSTPYKVDTSSICKDEPQTEMTPELIDKPIGYEVISVEGTLNIDEPQTDIHGLTDCDFCKERNCEDCEGGKDEPQTDCAWRRSEE